VVSETKPQVSGLRPPQRRPSPLKLGSGFERFPFVDLDANRAWLAEVCFADALVRWFQLLCSSGPLAVAEPKALRWALWHSPARVVRKAGRWVVRILEGWPTADALLAAYRRIALIT
jgi:hypothetical protein